MINWLFLVSSKLNISKSFNREVWCWISFSLWIIWKARCDVIYEHVAPNPIGTVHRIIAVVTEFLSAKFLPSSDDSGLCRSKVVELVRWCAPNP